MSCLVIHTKPSMLLRGRQAVRAFYLRFRVRAALQDVQGYENTAAQMNNQIASHGVEIAKWRAELHQIEIA